MKIIISIIGKSNVGKSTLFNKLIYSNYNLINKYFNTSIDRNYGVGKINRYYYTVIDTGSFNIRNFFFDKIIIQIKKAINNSNIILFIVDNIQGISEEDKIISNFLKKINIITLLIINKIDNFKKKKLTFNYYKLGLGKPYFISAKNNIGIKYILKKIIKKIKYKNINIKKKKKKKYIKIIVIGKQNVGKSTLINTLIKKNRLIISNIPGTTKNCNSIKFNYKKYKYIITDTIGLYKKKNILNKYENISIYKTLKFINTIDIVLFIIDINKNISNQDINIINFIINLGKSLIICINKCDLFNINDIKKKQKYIKNIFYFLKYINICYISAKNNIGILNLLKKINNLFKILKLKFKTSILNKIFKKIIKYKKKNIKFKFINQVNNNPLTIIIYINNLNKINNNFKLFLKKYFKKYFLLKNITFKIIFKKYKK